MKRVLTLLLVGLSLSGCIWNAPQPENPQSDKGVIPLKLTSMMYQAPVLDTYQPKTLELEASASLPNVQVLRSNSYGVLRNLKLELGLSVQANDVVAAVYDLYSGISAPVRPSISGKVQQVLVHDGQILSPNTVLAQIADQTQPLAKIKVDTQKLKSLGNFQVYAMHKKLPILSQRTIGEQTLIELGLSSLEVEHGQKLQLTFKENYQAKPTIYTQVPLHALKIKGQTWYCGVNQNGKLGFVAVQIQGFENGRALIKSGLEEKQQIMLYSAKLNEGILIN